MQSQQENTKESSRAEIISELLETGLADRCLSFQTRGCRNPYWVEEMRQEMWLWLLTYDIDKLCDAWENGHLNALITRYLRNQFNSKNSPFYKDIKKFDLLSDEITDRERNLPDG